MNKLFDKFLVWLLPHLSGVLMRISKHLMRRYGVCETCYPYLGGDDYEETN